MEAKIEVRRAIKERLSKLSENDRRVESQIIVREIAKILPKKTSIIAAYSPYLDEPNITSLITELVRQKNVICMGKTNGHHMAMHAISDLSLIHRNPITNILEPSLNNPVNEVDIAVAIIPGRAFTKDGQRMGRGNGGYDRWMREQRKRNPQTLMIGVCFDCQILPVIPMEEHDESVDIVISGTRIFRKE